MLLKEERRIKISEQGLELAFTGIRTRTLSRKAIKNLGSESGCSRCGKRYKPEQYWTLHSELAPEWL